MESIQLLLYTNNKINGREMMNKMKKLLCATMAVIVMLSSTACNGSNKKGEDSESITYEKGILTETTFESESLNLKFQLPDGYVMATQEDLDNILDDSCELVFQDENKTVVDYLKMNTFYEMMAANSSYYPSVMIISEKPTLSNMTMDQYIENQKKQLQSLDLDYAIEDEVKDYTLLEEEYKELNLSSELPTISVYQRYLIRKVGNRFVALIISYTDDQENEVETLLDSFSTYK